MELDLSRAALLPLDMQAAFDHAPWGNGWNASLDDNGKALLRHWRQARLPIIHVRHDSIEPRSSLRPGEPGNAFRPGFAPLTDEGLVIKSVNAAFIGTDLALRLRRLDVDTIFAFGLSTDQCVSTTVRVGANLGYRMVLVEDACDCFDLPGSSGELVAAETLQRAHVASLRGEFATILRTDAALHLLARHGLN